MWTQWITVAAPLLVCALVVMVGFRRPTGGELDRWIHVYSCPADEVTRAVVGRYLTRTRRTRFSFALAGFIGGQLSYLGDAFSWVNPWIGLVAGYLVGSIVAEVAFGRGPRPSGAITVALSPRTITSYIPRSVITALVVVPIATVAVAIWQVGVAAGVPARFGNIDPEEVKAAAAAGIVLAIAVGAALAALVRQPQSTESAQAIATDDAFRSSSMHAIAGATLTLSFFLLATVLAQLNAALAATGSPLAFSASIASFFALLAALASWLLVRHPSHWSARRLLASTPSEAL